MKTFILTSLRAFGWSVGSVAVIFAAFISLPVVASIADRHGAPGGAIALIGFVGLAAGSLAIAASTMPSRRRMRAIAREARALHLNHSTRFEVPATARALPLLSEFGYTHQLTGLIAGRGVGSADRLAFDGVFSGDAGYAPGRPITLAVTHGEVKLPWVVVAPRSHPGPTQLGVTEVHLESAVFTRRYRVSAEDARCASALIDQRMQAWLIDVEDDWRFEVGGWAIACAGVDMHPAKLGALFAALDGFVSHIPRVLASLYGESLPSPVERGTDSP